jgi:putative PIN family toxin of toxin-antitoxin system
VIKVVDTTVFGSFFFGGRPRKVADLWKSGRVSLCLSKPIIDEYVAVLQRLGLQNERELSELLGLFARDHHIDFCARKPQLHVVEEDADDNKFIECAVALRADYVISGDKSLLGIREYMDISIVTPKDFLDTCMGHYS